MQIYIFDQNYDIIGTIDEAESVLWSKKYNDVGEAEIYIPCNDMYIALLAKGNYLYRYDDDMFCRIETVEIKTDVENGDYIIATAADMCKILSGRIVRWQIVFSGKVVDFIKKLLTDNVVNPEKALRKIENFEIDDSNFDEFTETINVTTVADDILQLIIATCKTYNYGFRVSYNINTQKLVFRLYKGENKATIQSEEYVEFSPRFANILSSNYKEDESDYKNVAYVSFKNEQDVLYIEMFYRGNSEPQGDERREIYVDASSTSRDITEDELQELFPSVQEDTTGKKYYITVEGERQDVATYTTESGGGKKIKVTDYTYSILIQAIGQNALADHNITQEYSGAVDTIDTYEYKEDYDLGDIVKVINEYGIEVEAQITEVLESEDNDSGYQIEPKFEYIN